MAQQKGAPPRRHNPRKLRAHGGKDQHRIFHTYPGSEVSAWVKVSAWVASFIFQVCYSKNEVKKHKEKRFKRIKFSCQVMYLDLHLGDDICSRHKRDGKTH